MLLAGCNGCVMSSLTASAVRQLCRVPLDMGGGVRSCDLADPYTAVLLADGTVALVELCEGEKEDSDATLTQTWPEIAKVVCCNQQQAIPLPSVLPPSCRGQR